MAREAEQEKKRQAYKEEEGRRLALQRQAEQERQRAEYEQRKKRIRGKTTHS